MEFVPEITNSKMSFEMLVAAYGAIVGTVALLLNFLRYRHSLGSTRPMAKIEVEEVIAATDFKAVCKKMREDVHFISPKDNSVITHKINIKNTGRVSIHIAKAWAESDQGIVNGLLRENRQSGVIYQSLKELGAKEVVPGASIGLSVFSNEERGYLLISKVFVESATGKKWKSFPARRSV